MIDLIVREPSYLNEASAGTAASVTRGMRLSDVLRQPLKVRGSLSFDYRPSRFTTLEATLFRIVGTGEFRTRVAHATPEQVLLKMDSVGRSTQEGLNVNLTTNRLPRMLFSASYTISSARDDGSAIWTPPSGEGNAVDVWGAASNDSRHRLSVSAFAELRSGVRATLQMRYLSSTPYEGLSPLDLNHDGFPNDRASGLQRNALRGQGRTNFNFTASWSPNSRVRSAPVDDAFSRRGFSVYLSASNLLNFPNYNRWYPVVGTTLFRQPIAAGPARRVELGFKWWR